MADPRPGRDLVYLVPGFFGFEKLGPFEYFVHVQAILRAHLDPEGALVGRPLLAEHVVARRKLPAGHGELLEMALGVDAVVAGIFDVREALGEGQARDLTAGGEVARVGVEGAQQGLDGVGPHPVVRVPEAQWVLVAHCPHRLLGEPVVDP